MTEEAIGEFRNPISSIRRKDFAVARTTGRDTMCGRYTLEALIDVLAEWLEVDEYLSSLTPSYNIAPLRSSLQWSRRTIRGSGHRLIEQTTQL